MGWFIPALIGAGIGAGAGYGLSQMGGEEPTAPSFQSQIPDWAKNLPPEILQYIRQGVGQQLQEPSEYGISSQALQNMLQYQPSQFQFPMGDIQAALAAQQAQQFADYEKQITPILAGQGQLDSTYYANLISDYLRGQQTQRLGTTADLLTQQAQQNYNLQQWLPQFQAGVAGQLGGIGQQRQGVGQFNMTYPYQTYIPALQQMYGTGLQQAGQQYQSALVPYQQQLQNYQQSQQQQQALMQALGGLAMGAGTGALGGAAGLYGTGVGAGKGALLGLSGYSPGLSQLIQGTQGTGNTRFYGWGSNNNLSSGLNPLWQ